MPVFKKAKRKERREKRKERRQVRVQNATRIVTDAVDKGTTVAESVSSNGVSLKKREDRIVRTSERVLIIFSEFNEFKEDKKVMEMLYGFVERQGVAAATGVLSQLYSQIIPCTGSTATLSKLIKLFEDVLSDDDVEEIDLIWHGHGSKRDNGYFFSMAPEDGAESYTKSLAHKGSYHVDDIVNAFDDLEADERLRMFYTTACESEYLAKGLVDAGFSCGAGALDINTNSAIEYPLFLRNWALSLPFGVALSNAFTKSRWRVTDAAVRPFDRFEDADSTKRQFGDVMTTIRTNGDF
ncbi:hypothetical protein S7335_334 [Synechococcus sp. PCC 7335]|uniref:hypothetical protein n=1 Tax=Synechococcus sp. (strain ATCC 29403 / PCC 7335) TaxID=91464 RepID=UPI00017EB90C|nr:hypothetical protein [Synechococcus sp. PCC 7335]EDX83155.1 hypothetical protein S7335_334 [Synechococcus sp. PCC 7335]